MSDSEGDIDDELLALAGASEKKRKRHQSSGAKTSKRRRPDVSSSDDDDKMEPESEEEEENSTQTDANPYPLEGKYVDEADRQRLLEMSEIEREDELAQRQEEMQRKLDKRNLEQMIKEQSKNGIVATDPDSVSKAAKRQHAVRGATKEKSRKLDELKAKRKAKDEKKQRSKNSPKRDRSSSPMEMETDDDEEEDGQITRLEQEEEKERRLLGLDPPPAKPTPVDAPSNMEDLNRARLSRDQLAKHCNAPWFADYVAGSWVRYLIGHEGTLPVYRVCQIIRLIPEPVRPYKINDQTVNQNVILKHADAEKAFQLDKVSNAPIEPKEYERLKVAYQIARLTLPTRGQLDTKLAQLQKLAATPMTESDVTAMLARRNQMQTNGRPSAGSLTMERSRLNQARTLAYRRGDQAEVDEINIQLQALASNMVPNVREEDTETDVLAKVNERNRKANLLAVRRAEMAEAERKRKERKLAASRGSATPVPTDPSARLKMHPRTFNPATPASTRPGTPNALSQPQLAAAMAAISPGSSTNGTSKRLESTIIDSLELDLGDF